MTRKWGTPPGSTFWYRLVDGEYETVRCNPGTTPDGTDWIHGQRPKSDAEKKQASEIHLGRVMSPEWRAKMSAASKGKKKSPEHVAAMVKAVAEYHRKRKAGLL
jgi:hypothetical protein